MSIKIGFLTPFSGIYPYYSQHLMAGFYFGLEQDPQKHSDIQFVPEYTHMGGSQDVKGALDKLLFFHQVDIVSGLISYRVIPEVLPVLEKFKKIGFVFDLGEYIPKFDYLSDCIFYASHQLWQSEFALGRWAKKEYGDGGFIVAPLYEAGYHLHSAFKQGTASAGGSGTQMHIVPSIDGNVSQIDLDPFFKHIADLAPPYIHAIFSGEQGNQFLARWISEGFNKKIPLLLVENMLYEDWLNDLRHMNASFYGASLYNRGSESPDNIRFRKQFESHTGQAVNIYSLLGFEAGLIFKEAMPYLRRRDWDAVKKIFKNGIIRGPRGEKNFFPNSGFALPVIDIMKVSLGGPNIQKTIIDQGIGLKFNDKEFDEIQQESISGWKNPYLCV